MVIRPPEHFVHGIDGAIVIVTARACAYLNRYAELERFRREHRGEDPEIDALLVAFRVAEMSWRSSAIGTKTTPTAEPPSVSEHMGTTAVADLLKVSNRAVVKAIADGHLKATKRDGRWQIAADDVHHYLAGKNTN